MEVVGPRDGDGEGREPATDVTRVDEFVVLERQERGLTGVRREEERFVPEAAFAEAPRERLPEAPVGLPKLGDVFRRHGARAVHRTQEGDGLGVGDLIFKERRELGPRAEAGHVERNRKRRRAEDEDAARIQRRKRLEDDVPSERVSDEGKGA